MWSQENPSPAEFWEQTPRSFAVWSKGRAKAAHRGAEDRLALAYMTAAFSRADKPKPLDFYLAQLKPKKRQTPEEMLAILRQFQAGGAPIDIKAVN